MGYTAEQIAGIVERRRRDRSVVIANMRRIRDVCNNDITVPLPELDEHEEAAVPNLIARAVEQTASRATSVPFDLRCPPKEADDESRSIADKRKHAIYGWWEHSDLELAAAQQARWFVGYGMACTIVRPDTVNGVPAWEIRDPLDAYPPPPTGNPVRDLTPRDCAFIHRHPYSWLLEQYPRQAVQLTYGRSVSEVDPSEMFEVIEWFDQDEEVLIGLANPVQRPYDPWKRGPSAAAYTALIELDRMRNRIGRCQVVTPGRLSMDRPRGQFDASVGMYIAHAKLMSLAMIATEQDVFPDQFLVPNQPGQTAEFDAGPYDGRTGKWNIIRDGIPQQIHAPVGPSVTNFLDRIERSEAISGGIPAEYQGESSTNIRTGRRGEQVLEAVLNFPLAEMQKILARARAAETRVAQAIAKKWFGDTEKTLFVEMIDRGVTYRPNDFDSDVVSVVPPIAGTDANNLIVAAGQSVGLKAMSRQTMMQLSPFIRDAEHENDQIQAEALDDALLAGLQQQIVGGMLSVVDAAKIKRLVKSNRMSLEDAIEQVHADAQQRQASSGEPGTPAGPVPPGSPEAQPGLSPPGMGQEQPTAPPQQAPASLQQALAMAFGGR